MSWLEIIHLRSSGEPLDDLINAISESLRAEGKTTEVLTLYRRDGLGMDVAIHIRQLEKPGKEGPSTLGLRFASALRDYGLVEHTLWEALR